MEKSKDVPSSTGTLRSAAEGFSRDQEKQPVRHEDGEMHVVARMVSGEGVSQTERANGSRGAERSSGLQTEADH